MRLGPAWAGPARPVGRSAVATAVVLAGVFALGSVASVANPSPSPSPRSSAAVHGTAAPAAHGSPAPPRRINVMQLQPKALAPTKALHVEFTVEVNKLGQVARVRTVKPSHDESYDAKMYGNALQAFIRTADGQVVLGTYRLTYDYDPKTQRVRRDVALVKTGGVDPNAEGAANEMMDIARRNRTRTPPPGFTPAPAPSVNIRRMPDLPQVMKSPSH